MLPGANRGGGTAGLAYAKFIHVVGGHSDKSSAKLSSRQRRQTEAACEGSSWQVFAFWRGKCGVGRVSVWTAQG